VKLAGDVRLQIDAQLGERYVMVTWPTPASYAAGDAELAVVQRLLAGGRLQRRALREDPVARSVSALHRQSVFGQFGGLFEITAVALDARASTDVLAAIDDELARLRAGETTDAEVASARASLDSELIFSSERLMDRAERINEYAQMLGAPAFFDRDRLRLQSVTRAGVAEAARRWLPSDRRVVTFVTPNATMREGARLVRATRVGTAP
jgi:predicted Zn-dependent peptidase